MFATDKTPSWVAQHFECGERALRDDSRFEMWPRPTGWFVVCRCCGGEVEKAVGLQPSPTLEVVKGVLHQDGCETAFLLEVLQATCTAA